MSPKADNRTEKRPNEAEVMALLEQIIAEAADAERYIQDDSRISGASDRQEITERLMRIRSLTMEIERIVSR